MHRAKSDPCLSCASRSEVLIILTILIAGSGLAQISRGKGEFPRPQILFAPREYVCYRVADSITIDGRLDEQSWKNAAWTDYFVDIEGPIKPAPLFKTRVKMLWDDKYLYVGAEIQEPNLWATLRQRDTVIFRDNDFEVFIDPNGSTQPYYETEINALCTVWDLLLREPYRDIDRAAVNAWDIKGLKVGVAWHGTLNNPSDVDTGWTAEIAFPWDVLGECAFAGAPPKEGAQWRINFSRVEWRTKAENGVYRKEINPETSQPYPEYNWVWSPQGLINMHYPEMWGFVQFSDKTVGSGDDPFVWNSVEDAKWDLRLIYYAERQWFNDNGSFTDDPAKLGVQLPPLKEYILPPKIYVTPTMFEAVITSTDGRRQVHINQEGRTQITQSK